MWSVQPAQPWLRTDTHFLLRSVSPAGTLICPDALSPCRSCPSFPSLKVRILLDKEAIGESVQLLKRKDHFIFTIESTGILPPQDLLIQALDILHDKAQRLADKL